MAEAMDGSVDEIAGSPTARRLPMEDGKKCILVTMPTATNVTEAVFIAIIKGADNATRYFLLEKSALGAPMVAEWTSSSHVNYGSIDSEDEAAFIAKINELLA